MRVLEKVTKLLKEQGKKQKDLTDFLGLSGQAVTNWKNGNSNSYQRKQQIAVKPNTRKR